MLILWLLAGTEIEITALEAGVRGKPTKSKLSVCACVYVCVTRVVLVHLRFKGSKPLSPGWWVEVPGQAAIQHFLIAFLPLPFPPLQESLIISCISHTVSLEDPPRASGLGP